jgi:hypothetical protein
MALTRHRLVAEVTVAVDSAGTLQTFYFGTGGFATGPADTPANTVVQARLADAGGFTRELFAGARVSGGVRASFGELVLHNLDGALDAWIGYGTGAGRVVVRWGPEGGAYPASYTTAYVARIFSVRCDFATVRLVLRDSSYLLDRPVVTQTFAGTGGLEGTATAGRRKQLVMGRPGYIPLVPVDAERRIYFVQANATPAGLLNTGTTEPSAVVFDGGLNVYRSGRAESFDSLRASAPADDTYIIWGDNSASTGQGDAHGPVYIKVGANVPAGELRMLARGMLQNSATEPQRHWRFTDLCQRAGLSDVTPTSLAAGSEDIRLGNRLVEGETYAELLNDVARAELVAYGFTRLGTAYVRRLADPADTTHAGDVVQYRFTKHNSGGFTRLPVPGMENPVHEVLVRAGRTWPCPVRNGAAPGVRAELERQTPFVSFTASAPSVLAAYPGAEATTLDVVGRYFTTPAEQRSFAERYLRLYGGARDHFRLTCSDFSATTLALELHDKVELELDRFGCSPARTFRVVSIKLNLMARTIEFGLWGGAAGPAPSAVEVATSGDPPGSAGGGSIPGGSPQLPTPSAVPVLGRLLMPPFTMRARAVYAGLPGALARSMGSFTLRASATITPADALFDDVVLLLHADGTDGSTTITDSSSYAHTCTAAGGAKISTDVAAMFGGASLKMDGTSAVVNIPDHACFDFGAGAVCWELRGYLTGTAGGYVMAKASTTTGLAYEWSVYVSSTGVTFYYGTRGTNQALIYLAWPATVPLNTVFSACLQRDAYGQWACFLDGVKGTQYQVSPLGVSISYGPLTTGVHVDAVNIGATTNPVTVGNFNTAVFSTASQLYMEEVRMTVGSARYTGSRYTPATKPFPDL